MTQIAQKPDLPPPKCDAFDKVYCHDCELILHRSENDQLLQHLKDRDQELETPVCGNLPCAYCDVHFSRRDALIRHYESGPCQPLLKRLGPIPSINISRLWTAALLFEHRTEPLTPPPAIATKRSWNARTQRYKCYLCITDHLGFLSLPSLNEHLAGSIHAAGRYQCPYPECRRLFRTLPGLVQHIETRTCHCMHQYNWLAFYVLNGDARILPPVIVSSKEDYTPIDGDTLHIYYTRGQATRLARNWVYRRDSRWKEAVAWGRRACVSVAELPHWFMGNHQLVFATGGVMLLGLGYMVYTHWAW